MLGKQLLGPSSLSLQSIHRGWKVAYYVDATRGNDANDGRTPSTPWRTVAKVNASAFLPSDWIRFKRGETWLERLVSPSSGVFGSPIVFGAYGSGALPALHSPDANAETIQVLTRAYNTFENLHVTTPWSGASGVGVRVQSSNNIAVKGCTVFGDLDQNTKGIDFFNTQNMLVHNCDVSHHNRGIGVQDAATSGVISHNTIYDLDKGATPDWDGIVISGGVSAGITIEDNEIYGFNEDGIDALGAGGLIIQRNYIHDSAAVKVSNNQHGIKSGVGGNIIRYNWIEDITAQSTSRYGIFVDGGDTEVYYNVIVNMGDIGIIVRDAITGVKVYNNTVYGLIDDAGIRVRNGAAAEVKNNIISSSTADLVIDDVGTVVQGGFNNLVNDAAATVTGATYNGGGDDLGTSNPLIVGGGDYHLQAGSPCRDAGTDVSLTEDYDGVAVPQEINPAIGAYEYV